MKICKMNNFLYFGNHIWFNLNIYHSTLILCSTTGAAGVGAIAPPKLWFGENPVKFLKIREKSVEIWSKYLKAFTKSLKI